MSGPNRREVQREEKDLRRLPVGDGHLVLVVPQAVEIHPCVLFVGVRLLPLLGPQHHTGDENGAGSIVRKRSGRFRRLQFEDNNI